jgi:FkbM family methyltransferase
MPPMTRAAGYVRTSPVDEEQDLSAEAQRARLERDIAERGWQLSHVYEDDGPAALPWRLPGLQEALEEAPNLDRLVVVRFDRVATSVQRAIRVLARLQDAGCELVCLDQGIDTGDDSGRMLRGLLEGLVPTNPAAGVPRAGGWTSRRIRRHQAEPATVIDVGAGAGTPALYEAFPDAHHVLIEPLVEFETALQALVAEGRAEYIPTAVGTENGETTLNVTSDLYSTSALRRTAAQAAEGIPRQVPITTLDALLRERQWTPPFCLKIDVEGYEHAVIEGAREVLDRTELIVAEVSVSRRFDGALNSAELIGLMSSHGFEVADVVDAGVSSTGVHADLVFKRREAQSS